MEEFWKNLERFCKNFEKTLKELWKNFREFWENFELILKGLWKKFESMWKKTIDLQCEWVNGSVTVQGLERLAHPRNVAYRVSHKKVYLFLINISQASNISQIKFITRNKPARKLWFCVFERGYQEVHFEYWTWSERY